MSTIFSLHRRCIYKLWSGLKSIKPCNYLSIIMVQEHRPEKNYIKKKMQKKQLEAGLTMSVRVQAKRNLFVKCHQTIDYCYLNLFFVNSFCCEVLKLKLKQLSCFELTCKRNFLPIVHGRFRKEMMVEIHSDTLKNEKTFGISNALVR